MIDQLFWWIGYVVSALLSLAWLAFCLFWIWANFIHRRIDHILFRKTERRLSIASWFNHRLMSDAHFHADDWPICQRPLFLSYKIGSRRIFLMAGMLEQRRNMPIRGDHPDRPTLGEGADA